MYIYAGIDEAGYGPMYGPLTIGCAVLALPNRPSDAKPPALWDMLDTAICKRLQARRGRIVVNDSKKLTTKAAGIKHLELSLLAFTQIQSQDTPLPQDVGQWLDLVGESRHRPPGSSETPGSKAPENRAPAKSSDTGLTNLPWYHPTPEHPWQPLPSANTPDELTLACGMLGRACKNASVVLEHLATQVIYEDEFNQRVARTRSKASVSFTAVARHLLQIMRRFGQHHPHVAVDRQSGRTRYRDLLAQVFEGARIDILEESKARSTYHIAGQNNTMTVSFLVEAEQAHLPVALASMSAKYTRELLMQRFNAYFTALTPDLAPTAGYGSDANRWRDQALPTLAKANIDHAHLRRLA